MISARQNDKPNIPEASSSSSGFARERGKRRFMALAWIPAFRLSPVTADIFRIADSGDSFLTEEMK